MTKQLVIGTDRSGGARFYLRADAVTQTFGILAMRGAGKSNLGAVMAEAMFAHGLPFVVIDPVGAWWGLRSSADGKGAGLAIPIFGGRHGDVPLERTSGELLADLVVARRLSCIVDVSDFDSEAAKKAFLLAFAQRLYKSNTQPLHLFLEEADDYIPQRAMKDELKLLRAWENIVRRGRARGLGITLITQRSAALNKNVLTQIETLFVLRTTSPQDSAIEAWVQHHGQKKELMTSLASLMTGEAWCWSPHWLAVMDRIRVARRSTFDSGATPTATKNAPGAATLADVDLPELQKEWAAVIERAAEDDPAVLRARIAALEKRRRAEDDVDWQERYREARGELSTTLGASREVIERLEELLASYRSTIDGMEDPFGLRRAEGLRGEPIGQKLAAGDEVLARRGNGNGGGVFFLNEQHELPQRRRSVGSGAMRVLAAVAQHPSGLTRSHITVLTGFKRSTRDSYIQRLRQGKLIELEGAKFVATDKGRQALGSSFRPLPTGKALREHWIATLPQGERALLHELIAKYPNYVERDQLSTITGYRRSTRDSYLQRLGARELVEAGDTGVRASALLFS